MNSQDSKPAKKQYDSPQLVVYGDIRAITLSFGKSGALDGANGDLKKTQT